MDQLIKFLNKTNIVFFVIIPIFLLAPIPLGFIIGKTFLEKIIYSFLFLFTLLFIFEIIFQFLYRLKWGLNYKFIKKVPFNKLFHEPHPYIPFVYKKNFDNLANEQFIYPLHPELRLPYLKTNNLGYFNGEAGNKSVEVPKPKNLIRINCIGGSTTGNYLMKDNIVYSYPLELERILKKKHNIDIEVNNFGHGGYNSADLFVSFALQNIETKPDYVIIYHAYNDIRSYLTPGFSSDYFHSRKNLGEVYWKYFLSSKIPNIKLSFINYIINKHLLSFNENYSLLDTIAKGEANLNQDYKLGLKTYERNLQHIIDICKSNKIKVILSSYCFHLYTGISKEPSHNLYQKIVLEENEVIKKLSLKNNLPFVDSANLIKKTDENFVDSIHLSPEGMKQLANLLSKEIKLDENFKFHSNVESLQR